MLAFMLFNRTALMGLLGWSWRGKRLLSIEELRQIITLCQQGDRSTRHRLLACYLGIKQAEETQALILKCQAHDDLAWKELIMAAEDQLSAEIKLLGLIARCLMGDEDACRELIQTYEQAIKTFFASRLYPADAGEVQSLCQEVFIKTFKNLHKYNPAKGSFKNYLYTQATWVWQDFLRAAASKGRIPWQKLDPIIPQAEGGPPEMVDEGPSPSDKMAENEEFNRLREALEKLALDNPQCRKLFELYYFQELTRREIGEELGINEKSIDAALRSCREKLWRKF